MYSHCLHFFLWKQEILKKINVFLYRYVVVLRLSQVAFKKKSPEKKPKK